MLTADRAILDAVLVISYFNFVNRLVEGLGVEPDEQEVKDTAIKHFSFSPHFLVRNTGSDPLTQPLLKNHSFQIGCIGPN